VCDTRDEVAYFEEVVLGVFIGGDEEQSHGHIAPQPPPPVCVLTPEGLFAHQIRHQNGEA